MIVLVFLESAAAVVTDLILDCRSTQEVLFYFCHILRMDFPLLWRKIIFWQVFGNFGGSLEGYGDRLIRWPFSVTVYVRFVKLQYSFGELYPSFLRSTANDRYSGKTVRLFLSSKAVVSSKPVNKPSSISSKMVVSLDNLSSIVVVSAIVVFAIAVVCCIQGFQLWQIRPLLQKC